MTLMLASTAIAPLAAGCAEHVYAEESTDEGAIIGGSLSDARDDAVVALLRNNALHCGAVVVGRNVLVTAASCLFSKVTVEPASRRGVATPTVNARDLIQPNELEVYIGTTPGARPSALAARFATAPAMAECLRTGNDCPLPGRDIAIVYVQGIDPRLSAIRPLALAETPVRRTMAVTVIGYGPDPTRPVSAPPASALPANPMDGLPIAGLRGGETPDTRRAEANSGFVSYEVVRQRRAGVEVLTTEIGESVGFMSQDRPEVRWTAAAQEFSTNAVACAGDSGGPAIDDRGFLTGIISVAVARGEQLPTGHCARGHLTTYTDVSAHRAFIARAIAEVDRGGLRPDARTLEGVMPQYAEPNSRLPPFGYPGMGACLDDSYCGDGRDGSICDIRTGRCMRGCRGGTVACGSIGRCSLETDALYRNTRMSGRAGFGRDPLDLSWGRAGICRSSSLPDTSFDPIYDSGPYLPPRGVSCPGDPRCALPGSLGHSRRECTSDPECGGAPGRPRVCDVERGRCMDGCRVGQATACAPGKTCGALPENPALGTCRDAANPSAPTTPAIVSPTAPPPNATPPLAQVETDGSGPVPTPRTEARTRRGQPPTKPPEEGCQIHGAPGHTSSLGSLGALLLTCVSALRRRTRR